MTAAYSTGSFAVDVELYVAHSLRVCALPKRMLRVLHHHNMLTGQRFHCADKSINHAVALPCQRHLALGAM